MKIKVRVYKDRCENNDTYAKVIDTNNIKEIECCDEGDTPFITMKGGNEIEINPDDMPVIEAAMTRQEYDSKFTNDFES